MNAINELPLVDQDMGIWSLHYYLELFPDDTRSRHELAQRYVEHGDHKQAVREYRKLLCLEPYCYQARLELADSYVALEMLYRAACELRLLTMVASYAQIAWQRLARIDMYVQHDFSQTEAAAQQQVWDLLMQ